jgi:hypothetical protein
MSSGRLELALQQLREVRAYVLPRLNDFSGDEWFAMPGGITNAAWQAGHLAMAAYRMLLVRTRGERPTDAEFYPPEYMTLFGIKSVPQSDPSKYPPPSEIMAVFTRVHEQGLRECASLTEADLDAEVTLPHPLFHTKLGSLLTCARHEMMHAGQIGMLRRLLGKPPLW